MKNLDAQGETKSGPKEIEKLATRRCHECGLVAVPPIVVGSTCSNAAACAKRRHRTEKLTTEKKP